MGRTLRSYEIQTITKGERTMTYLGLITYSDTITADVWAMGGAIRFYLNVRAYSWHSLEWRLEITTIDNLWEITQ